MPDVGWRAGTGMIMTPQSIAMTRVLVALAQGLAIYRLYEASEAKAWPATDGLLNAPAVAVALFVPVIVIVGIGSLRGRTLAIWASVATLLCVGLAVHDV